MKSSTLRLISASRLSSGFRRRPAVMQIRSASARRLVAAGMDHLVGDRRRAMEHVERLAVGQIRIDVDDHDLMNDAAELQGEARRGSHDPAAADDADLHAMLLA